MVVRTAFVALSFFFPNAIPRGFSDASKPIVWVEASIKGWLLRHPKEGGDIIETAIARQNLAKRQYNKIALSED
ncbi:MULTISPECIES: hypothetical protein [Spirulina sp. CCY15215]|uniref:hypothetical protein n=1 Tax=Spirulina sp. CCY15215 TaxID=2767591 RepID=UPI001950F8AF|nr:hypothetical protein [Spirulina major]